MSLSVQEREALLAALVAGTLPDEHGRFGPYGDNTSPRR
jgi:hypothetical protein